MICPELSAWAGTIRRMLAAALPTGDGGGHVQLLTEDGTPAAPPRSGALATVLAEVERAHRPRWLWPSTAEVYPALLAADVRVERCHDLTLAEGLLLGYDGRHGEPRGVPAAWARLRGLPVPDDPPPRQRDTQPTLFEPPHQPVLDGADGLQVLIAVHADQQQRLRAAEDGGALRTLVAAESAAALTAAEMSHHGLPWRADLHHRLLTDLLGPRPSPGERPRELARLAERIVAAFGGRAFNPDHPASVVQAFRRAGIEVESSRAWLLRDVDHPAVEPLLAYKELSRLYTAHGWHWLDSWIHSGRFNPEWVVGGVVSGRWATRGGAALQIPRVLRQAVVADPGWTFVVADAAQLEPRILAALSGDRRLAEVSAAGDLYASLAADSFDGDRGRAKIALLSAMYGGTGGEAGPLLATLRRRFPAAVDYVEAAARTGEGFGLVRSRLGRTSPPSSNRVLPGETESASAQDRSRQRAREWGRFTRNFVVQASAADWATVLLATLRQGLAARIPAAELVFFQHDEVIVHCPEPAAADVVAEITAAGATAGRILFGDSPVRFPLGAAVVDRYSDAK